MQYSGATALRIESRGSLKATTPLGSIGEAALSSYEAETGRPVALRFRLEGNTVSFEADIPAAGLIIDPQLEWSTYYCVPLTKLACDAAGNVYGCGTTSTANPATTGAHQTIIGGASDAFLVKFNAAGQRVWATYYGGTANDAGLAVACRGLSVYLGGSTSSTASIATLNAHQSAIGGGTDALLVKFDTAGVRQWATYLGGSGNESITNIAVSIADSIFISGATTSTSAIATPGSHQSGYLSGTQAFLANFDPAGTRMWGTYYGGETVLSVECAADSAGNVFLGGTTQSTGYGTPGTTYPTNLGGQYDLFLAKFPTAGTRAWGSYAGSSGRDLYARLATDGDNAYLAGRYSVPLSQNN